MHKKRAQKKRMEGIVLVSTILFLFLMSDTVIEVSLHELIYLAVAIMLSCSLCLAHAKWIVRAMGVLLQAVLFLGQVWLVSFEELTIYNRICSVVFLVAAFMMEYHVLKKEHVYEYFSTTCASCLSFEDVRRMHHKLKTTATSMGKAGAIMTPTVMRDTLTDIHRNSVLRYVNKDTLSEEYLLHLEQTRAYPDVYIVLSDTGSPASDVIGAFTNKVYNHVSISFDPDLKTLISYNGGERVLPPGLNAEMTEFFFKKESSSIRIYRLAVSLSQKARMIEKVKQINQQGSAYHMLGFAMKKPMRSNIMFCSQFVYRLLELADAQYFDKSSNEVKPYDFVELDYDRKLEFVEHIQFSGTEYKALLQK